jgi:carboxyl-terminal processing protease
VLELSYADQDYKIGVISLPTFYFDFEAAARGDEDFKSSTRDVRKLLEELKEEEVDAVVVDLRNDGGGSLSEANQLVGLFIDTGPTVQIRYSGLRNGFTRSFGDSDPEVVYDGPLAVLVNRTSASASEIFAGAIQDYQRGIVLGGQTFGKGTVQEIIPMSFGQVKLTRSKFYRISGESTQHRGVLPDITFPDFYDAYDDIGESSLDGALPWDTVRPVEFRTYHPVQAFLPKLRELHEARAAESPDFQYMIDQIERTRQLRERELLPLNEEIVKADRERIRRIEFDAENLRRKLKGLELKEWVEEDDLYSDEVASVVDSDDSEASTTEESANNPEIAMAEESEASASTSSATDADADEEAEEPEETDPLLLESGRILADFINLSNGDLSARY